MTDQRDFLAFESMMHKIEIQHLLVLLIDAGALSQKAAANYLLGLAEMCHAPEFDHYRRYADVKAKHYEDLASALLGGSFLPRDTDEPSS